MKHSNFILGSLFLLGTAHGELVQNNLPINVTSNSFTADLQQGTAVYSGNVQAIQGTRKLEGDTLVIKRGSDGNIQSFMLSGTPAKTQERPSPNAAIAYGQAQHINYFPEQNIVKYIDNAQFTQGGNVFTGDLITYNTITQIVTSPQTQSGKGVTTLILPAYDDQQGNSSS